VRTRRDGELVELTVRDDGQGIAPQFLPFVFDRFRQADSTSTRVHGGLGLGLAIVRHLIELHGGTVEVRSEGLGKGAAFTVRLPLLAAATTASTAAAAAAVAAAPADTTDTTDTTSAPPLGAATQLAGVAVLVVDDEADARELLTAVLEHHGATVTAVACVQEALAAVGEHAPDVVVSDIGMPGADGYELARRLRALGDDELRGTPAVALTGFARPEDGARAADAGFDAHVAKPVDPVGLVAVIERVTRARREAGAEPAAEASA